jgi:MFS transporter, PPP family, 3-phenylpropionic acid transporter
MIPAGDLSGNGKTLNSSLRPLIPIAFGIPESAAMTDTRLGRSARLSALYGACFAGIGISMPFFPLWLETRGLDPSAIGVILSLPILTRVLVTAPLMSLVDRGIGPRRLLIASSVCLALAYLALSFAYNVYALAALVIAMAMAQAPLTSLCDLVATDAIRADPRLDYGRIRLWGSITFLLANVIGGYVLAATTPDAVIGLLAGFALAMLGVVPLAPSGSSDARSAEAAAPPATRAGVRLPPILWLLIGAASCIQASHAAVYAFGSLHWREQGFSEPAVGYLWAIGVVAEILLFMAAGRVVGRHSFGLGLLVLGAGAAGVRFLLMAFSPGLIATFALQALHGLSFGATHLGAMAALSTLAPAGSRGRAQGFLSTAVSLGIAAATVLSGVVYRAAGAWVFAAMVPVATIGLILVLVAARVLAGQPHRAGEGG